MKHSILSAILISLLIVGCTSHDVYFLYNSVSNNGWSKDTSYVFHVPITDTTATYNVYINIRNRGEYPYQNLWLFLRSTDPGNTLTKDSVECYLADQRGKWLGTGMGSIMEMPVLYKQNVRFSKPGTYNYRIVQGMRDSLLMGINDIGMRVEKVN
jgi:gliding motility-associated lipoprotein GldH